MTWATHYPVWDCSKKKQARLDTIIEVYQETFNRKTIPLGQQYWTFSGSYTDKHNNPIDGEFHQLEKSKLVTKKQFYAVDIDKKIIKNNKRVYPELNFILGDFLSTMKESCLNNTYNPAIVNCDNVQMKDLGIRYLVSLLLFLQNNTKNNVLVVGNIALNNPYQKSETTQPQELIDNLFKEYYILSCWDVLDYIYVYNGTGKNSKTNMGSLMLLRK